MKSFTEFMNEKWSQKYKRSIDCNNPKGFSQRAHCAGKEKNEEVTEEKLGKIHRTPGGPKKFAVKVKNDKGNVVTVRFGDPNMEIKRDDPERRKSFRARHHCDTDPGPRWKARYWSCKQWRAGKKVEG